MQHTRANRQAYNRMVLLFGGLMEEASNKIGLSVLWLHNKVERAARV